MKMHADKIFMQPPPISDELFLKVRTDTETLYKTITKVMCPYLKQEVFFNVEGLEHMKFKEWNKERVRADQYFRLKFFYLVPEVLKHSHTLQGKWETKGWERLKSHGSWVKVMKSVTFYEFVAVMGKIRIKIILKQVDSGQINFSSVIPFWHMKELETLEPKRKRLLHDGNPESD